VVHVHVQAHADRVGRDQEVDLLVLEQRHLGVAGAGAEAAHDDGAAATAPADRLGDGVDLGGAEGDDGAARRQAGQAGFAGVAELRQAGAGLDLGVRHQAAEQGPDGVSAEHHGFRQAARVQQAVGEDVAAVGIGAKLDFVDGDELHRSIQRHGLDRAGEVAGVGRDDLFLAGDQRHLGGALAGHQAFVVLARQQAERKADDAAGMRQHAVDGQVGLAGVGGAEHRAHAGLVHAEAICHAERIGAQRSDFNGFRGDVARVSPRGHARRMFHVEHPPRVSDHGSTWNHGGPAPC